MKSMHNNKAFVTTASTHLPPGTSCPTLYIYRGAMIMKAPNIEHKIQISILNANILKYTKNANIQKNTKTANQSGRNLFFVTSIRFQNKFTQL